MDLADARALLGGCELRGTIPQFTFDHSALYGDNLQMARRTFSKRTGTRLRIGDEVSFSPETRSMTWQMITCADLKVTENVVELKQDGATLYLRISSAAPFEVKVVSLSPPPLTYDKNIKGLKRLEIHWKRGDFQGDSATINVEIDRKPF
ncbi:MAG: hypothetical protein K8R52_07780, partial [Bacteroidales bacterium]|nr:hypothetical protein [Bacteroidales bacterium]